MSACIQAEPVVLNREATIDKLEVLAAEAAASGAQLLVFPETFVPAYPSSVWARALAGWAGGGRQGGVRAAGARVGRGAGPRRRPDRRDCEAPRGLDRHGRQRGRPRAARDDLQLAPLPRPGRLARLKHRKLVPTNQERLIWGQGDGGGLRALPTELGRVGGLICWENYMPLARTALYEKGVEIYLAPTADDGTPGSRRSFTSHVSRVPSSSPRRTSSGRLRTRTTFHCVSCSPASM